MKNKNKQTWLIMLSDSYINSIIKEFTIIYSINAMFFKKLFTAPYKLECAVTMY